VEILKKDLHDPGTLTVGFDYNGRRFVRQLYFSHEMLCAFSCVLKSLAEIMLTLPEKHGLNDDNIDILFFFLFQESRFKCRRKIIEFKNVKNMELQSKFKVWCDWLLEYSNRVDE
jgi:hypothetical protein